MATSLGGFTLMENVSSHWLGCALLPASETVHEIQLCHLFLLVGYVEPPVACCGKQEARLHGPLASFSMTAIFLKNMNTEVDILKALPTGKVGERFAFEGEKVDGWNL